MSALSKLKDAFTGTPELDPFEQQRLDAISRREAINRKLSTIHNRKRDIVRRRAALDDAPAALAAADKALADALVAVELGETPSLPVETLKEAAEKARIRDGEARQQAITAQSALDAYDGQIAPLTAALHAIHRELADLVPAIIDERLLTLKPKRDAAVAAVLAILREERVLVLAFDEYSTASARGEFRGSQDYKAINIPTPRHPAYMTQYPDEFARGRALADAHETHRQEERQIYAEAQALIVDITSGE